MEDIQKPDEGLFLQTQSIDIKTCPFNNITVFKDRAEITREISFDPIAIGEREIVISHLCASIDLESIRVKGTSMYQIIEVSHDIGFEEGQPPAATVDNTIDGKIQEVEAQIQAVESSLERLKTQNLMMKSYINVAVTGGSGVNAKPCDLTDAKSFLAFYADESLAYDNRCAEENRQLIELKERLQLLLTRRNLSILPTAAGGASKKQFYQAHVMVNITSLPVHSESSSISTSHGVILLTYVVWNVKWTPSYDIRIASIDKETTSMMLSYFADVTQSSGENWTDCRELCLSTSNPAIGSTPPALPRRQVKFEIPNYLFTNVSKSGYNDLSRSRPKASKKIEFCGIDDTERGGGIFNLMESGLGGGGDNDLGTESYMQTTAITASLKKTADTSPAVFVIPRKKVSIDSDGKPHKVTINVISLVPQLVHYVAPSLSTSVYLQAKTKNTSPYPLLPSEKVSIFLDGSFVSNSNLRRPTAPNDTFTVYLGVDPAFKVDYLPSKVSEKAKGWMSGSLLERKYEFTTVLYNTKQHPYRVIVAEVLPQSLNEKIVVELVQPTSAQLSKPAENAILSADQDAMLSNIEAMGGGEMIDGWPKDFVSLNKTTNSVVWLRTINPGDKIQLNFSYKIAWPPGYAITIEDH